MGDLIRLIENQPEYVLIILSICFIFITIMVLQSEKVVKIINSIIKLKQPSEKDAKPEEKPPDLVKIDSQDKEIVKQFEQHKTLHMIAIIIDGMQEPSLFMNYEGTILAWNHLMDAFTGYSQSEMLGADVSCLMKSPHAKLHDAYVKSYIKDKTEEYKVRIVGKSRPIEVLHKDGHHIPCMLRVTHIENGLSGFLGSFQKIRPCDTIVPILAEVTNTLKTIEAAKGLETGKVTQISDYFDKKVDH